MGCQKYITPVLCSRIGDSPTLISSIFWAVSSENENGLRFKLLVETCAGAKTFHLEKRQKRCWEKTDGGEACGWHSRIKSFTMWLSPIVKDKESGCFSELVDEEY